MAASRLTPVQWLICAIAAIGFAFDIYELLMLPLIIKPAIAALSAPLVDALVAGGMPRPQAMALWVPGGAQYVSWARTLFFVPAMVGGVFGLLGGYLTDRLGRRRVLTFSILLYALSALASGFVTSLEQLLVLRCAVFVGVCVEFVAAVAWLAELFDDPKQRERVLGYTQAFSSVGGILVAVANVTAASLAASLPAIHGGHEAWRYTLISGVIPALPLIAIRPFLPESPAWAAKRAAGLLRRPNIAELFGPGLARATIVTTLVFAASYGIAFGAIQQLPQILGAPNRGHVEILSVAAAARQAAIADAASKGLPAPPEPRLRQVSGNATDQAVATVSSWQEMGGLAGRAVFALIAVWAITRRSLLRIFQIPALVFVPLLFVWISSNLGTPGSLLWVKIGIFVAGFFTVAQFSFWGNYIPLVFPLHLRGTGESFAANIGGRVIGTAAAWFTLTFSESRPPDPAKIALVGAAVAGIYALVGAIATQWLPEPSADGVAEEGR
ncbi:MAG: MFS transporter [Vicinamibacteraceae bacterium]